MNDVCDAFNTDFPYETTDVVTVNIPGVGPGKCYTKANHAYYTGDIHVIKNKYGDFEAYYKP